MINNKRIKELEEELHQANKEKEEYFINAGELAKEVVILKKLLKERGKYEED